MRLPELFLGWQPSTLFPDILCSIYGTVFLFARSYQSSVPRSEPRFAVARLQACASATRSGVVLHHDAARCEQRGSNDTILIPDIGVPIPWDSPADQSPLFSREIDVVFVLMTDLTRRRIVSSTRYKNLKRLHLQSSFLVLKEVLSNAATNSS